MSNLLRSKQYFIVVDYKPKQGLFYQLYSKDGYLKSIPIHPYATSHFASTLDASDHLNIIAKTPKEQLLHIEFQKGIPKKRIVLEDINHLYDFSHLALHTFNDTLYLFYSVAHPTGSTRSLMYQTLNHDEEVRSLIPQLPHNTIIKTLATSLGVFIVYTDFTDTYQLNMVHMSADGFSHQTLLSSPLPIIDFNFCTVQNILHLVYVQDNYGKQKTYYMNTHEQAVVDLHLPKQQEAPCLFTFSDHLWLTYTFQEKLYMLLSVYASSSFSEPVLCSLEGSFVPFSYVTSDHFDLNGTVLHGLLTPKLRLGVVSSLDLLGLHPDLMPLSEVSLLLDGLKYATSPLIDLEIPKPMASHEAPSEPPSIPVIEDLPLPSKNLESAKEAFMRELPAFDASPKS